MRTEGPGQVIYSPALELDSVSIHAIINPLHDLFPHLSNGEICRIAIKIPPNTQTQEEFTFVDQFTRP